VDDLKVRRWAGAFGLAGFIVFLIALPLYFVGMGPGARLEDAGQFSNLVTRTNTFILIRTSLADPLIMVGFIVFLAGLRHLIRQARQEYEWVGSLVLAVGVVVGAVELVGDGLQAGAALDTWIKADPTAVRALNEGSFTLYGAIGLILAALLLASAGYATAATGVLHKWTSRVAYGAAVVNLAAAPSVLGGTDITGFYTASGYALSFAQAAMLIWFLVASISMIVKKEPARRR